MSKYVQLLKSPQHLYDRQKSAGSPVFELAQRSPIDAGSLSQLLLRLIIVQPHLPETVTNLSHNSRV